MPKVLGPAKVSDVTATYRTGIDSPTDVEQAWLDVEIDKGLASPLIKDRTARQVMHDIKARNRVARG
jgi:hypothetical protein